MVFDTAYYCFGWCTHFPTKKKKNNELITLDRGDFDFLWEEYMNAEFLSSMKTKTHEGQILLLYKQVLLATRKWEKDELVFPQ